MTSSQDSTPHLGSGGLGSRRPRSRSSTRREAAITANPSVKDIEHGVDYQDGLETQTEDDIDSELESLHHVTSGASVSMVPSYRQPSLAAAGSRAQLGSGILDSGLSRYPTKDERLKAREEERSLLLDNDLISPGRASGSLAKRLSRQVLASIPPTISPSEGHFPSDVAETAPLLGEPDSSEDVDQKWENAVLLGQIHTTWQRESKVLAKTSAPLVLTFLLQYSLTVASIFTVGHLGTVELAAVSLASMTANITGYAAYFGLATSLDTLCSQAYGSGKKKLVGECTALQTL